MSDLELLKSELLSMKTKTPRADQIDTINKVSKFKKLLARCDRLKSSKNIEEIRSAINELRLFHGGRP